MDTNIKLTHFVILHNDAGKKSDLRAYSVMY